MLENLHAVTARSYALIGFIFYILGAAAWIMSSLWSGFMMSGFMGSGMMGGLARPFFPSVFFIVSAALTVWAWITMNDIDAEKYQDAQTASLILGIFGIFFAWLIGGIFFLLAYGKLGAALRYQASSPKAQPRPAAAETPSRETGRFCPSCGKAASEDDQFCRYCGNKLT